MTHQKNIDHDISILGQTINYPKCHWGAISVLIVSTAISLIFYIIFVQAKVENLNKVFEWSAELVTEDKVLKEYSESYIVEFWTPSPESSLNLNVKKWEKDVTEVKLIEFGEYIKVKAGVLGYRRYLVIGEGEGAIKTGHWWVARVGKAFDKNKFVSKYQKFWKKQKPVYMEINRSGRYGE